MQEPSNQIPPDTLSYASPPERVTKLIWSEVPGELVVALPFQPEGGGKGCGWAMLTFVSALTLPLPIMYFLGVPGLPLVTTLFAEAMVLVLWWVCWRALQRPPDHTEPSVLSIQHGVMKLERAGPERDLDVSWDVDQISDVRFCRTTHMRRFSVWGLLLADRDTWVRMSIVLPTGQVEEIIFEAGPGPWVDALESQLRAYLKLS